MKKEFSVLIAIGILSILFGVVTFLLFVTGGKNRFFLAKKLLIGGLLISMTAACKGGRPPFVTCYEPVAYFPTPQVRILDDFQTDPLGSLTYFKFSQGESIRCFAEEIYGLQGLSYVIKTIEGDNEGDLLFSGNILPPDKESFKVDQFEFVIPLNPELSKGRYLLKIYSVSSAGNNTDSFITQTVISIE